MNARVDDDTSVPCINQIGPHTSKPAQGSHPCIPYAPRRRSHASCLIRISTPTIQTLPTTSQRLLSPVGASRYNQGLAISRHGHRHFGSGCFLGGLRFGKALSEYDAKTGAAWLGKEVGMHGCKCGPRTRVRVLGGTSIDFHKEGLEPEVLEANRSGRTGMWRKC
jgi:hypothetical protein